MAKLGRPKKPKVYIRKKVPKKAPPLTSNRTLTLERKKINLLNKARSKQMENRIAKTLSGRRIPMSGAAAAFKGDVEVLFENYPGKYIVECKLSSQKARTTREPFIPIRLDWFPKITLEASNMNAKFGIIIMHYQDFGNDYVFVKRSIVSQLITKYESPYADILEGLLSLSSVIDMRYTQAGKARTGYDLQRKDIELAMIQVKGFGGIRVITPDDEYLVIHLSTWRVVVDHM